MQSEHKKKIGLIIGRSFSDDDRVDGLQNLPKRIYRELQMLAIAEEGSPFLPLLYLRFITDCSLPEANSFVSEHFLGLTAWKE